MPRLRERDLTGPQPTTPQPTTPPPAAITDADRRTLAEWAAGCAERALPLFEARGPADSRPRAAIDGARAFSRGELRHGEVRSLALAAFAAARQVGDPAAAAAGRAAGSAAAVAMTHATPSTIGAAEHALGPAAYAALARERADGGDAAAREVGWAVEDASREVLEIVRGIPEGRSARGRVAELIADLHEALHEALRA